MTKYMQTLNFHHYWDFCFSTKKTRGQVIPWLQVVSVMGLPYETGVQQNRLRNRRNLVLFKCYFGKTGALANASPTFVLESIYCLWTETLKTLSKCTNQEIYLLLFILNKMFNNKITANISIRNVHNVWDGWFRFWVPNTLFLLSPEWRLEKLVQLLVQLY